MYIHNQNISMMQAGKQLPQQTHTESPGVALDLGCVTILFVTAGLCLPFFTFFVS